MITNKILRKVSRDLFDIGISFSEQARTIKIGQADYAAYRSGRASLSFKKMRVIINRLGYDININESKAGIITIFINKLNKKDNEKTEQTQ